MKHTREVIQAKEGKHKVDGSVILQNIKIGGKQKKSLTEAEGNLTRIARVPQHQRRKNK